MRALLIAVLLIGCSGTDTVYVPYPVHDGTGGSGSASSQSITVAATGGSVTTGGGPATGGSTVESTVATCQRGTLGCSCFVAGGLPCPSASNPQYPGGGCCNGICVPVDAICQ